MGKDATFEFIDGNRPPNDPLPRVQAYLDLSGEMLALRMRHEDDASDQHILAIERVEDRLIIRVRDIYPKNAPALCRLFGIEGEARADSKHLFIPGTDRRYGWPMVLAACPELHGHDHAMMIADDDGGDDLLDRANALEQTLKNLAVATARYMGAPDDMGLLDLEKPVLAGIAEAEDLISGDLEFSGSAAIVHQHLERERAMLAAMAKTNAAAKALLNLPADERFGHAVDDLEEAIAAQAELIGDAEIEPEVESEDADAPIAAPDEKPELDTEWFEGATPHAGEQIGTGEGGIFKVTTGDPRFKPDRPALINGYRYAPFPKTLSPQGIDAIERVLYERLRQVEGEGWTPEHDDGHGDGELLAAAICYAASAGTFPEMPFMTAEQKNAREAAGDAIEHLWPWDQKWWKPGDPIRSLEKAGGLILAEIERLLRLDEKAAAEEIDARGDEA